MILLSGHQYTAASPSLFHQLGHPVSIGYDGQAWRIAIRGNWATRPFASRAEAADTVAEGFSIAARENLA